MRPRKGRVRLGSRNSRVAYAYGGAQTRLGSCGAASGPASGFLLREQLTPGAPALPTENDKKIGKAAPEWVPWCLPKASDCCLHTPEENQPRYAPQQAP